MVSFSLKLQCSNECCSLLHLFLFFTGSSRVFVRLIFRRTQLTRSWNFLVRRSFIFIDEFGRAACAAQKLFFAHFLLFSLSRIKNKNRKLAGRQTEKCLPSKIQMPLQLTSFRNTLIIINFQALLDNSISMGKRTVHKGRRRESSSVQECNYISSQ